MEEKQLPIFDPLNTVIPDAVSDGMGIGLRHTVNAELLHRGYNRPSRAAHFTGRPSILLQWVLSPALPEPETADEDDDLLTGLLDIQLSPEPPVPEQVEEIVLGLDIDA